jgi:hypothetical protein
VQSLVSFLSNPIVWKLVVAYWLFSAAVDSLPQPNGNKFYQWLYAFLHSLAGNVKRAAQTFNVPGSQQ